LQAPGWRNAQQSIEGLGEGTIAGAKVIEARFDGLVGARTPLDHAPLLPRKLVVEISDQLFVADGVRRVSHSREPLCVSASSSLSAASRARAAASLLIMVPTGTARTSAASR